MKKLRVDPGSCAGCRNCELVCSFVHWKEFNPKRARLRVLKEEKYMGNRPILCKFCVSPKCVEACKIAALTKDNLGFIRVDINKCTGCGTCFEECPFAGIFIDPTTGLPIICDLCGGEPACVKWCPRGALSYERRLNSLYKLRGRVSE